MEETLISFIKDEAIEANNDINENTRLFGQDALSSSIQMDILKFTDF